MNLFRFNDSNYTNQKFNVSALVLVVLVLACFAISPMAQAVVPAPDGGYPGFNTAEGQNALFSLTTGAGNTAVGWFSLFSNTDGSSNTGVGAGTLLFNVGDQGTGEGVENTAIGMAALLFNATGSDNTAVGTAALLNNTTGGGNTANGYQALNSNTTGNFNTANGAFALFSNTAGGGNTAIGSNALSGNTGSNNTALGLGAGGSVTTANQVICIGTSGENVSNSCYIGNIFGQTSVGGTAVFINSNGRLGTTTSSRRFKEEIKPMGKASEAILALEPVSFRYKKEIDPQGIPQFGLLAEEVHKVNPDLVVRDQQGKPHTVRYEQINAMLLNEFLKEHRKVEQLRQDFESKLAAQQDQIEALNASLQKVSAQIQMSKVAPEVARINQ